MHQLVHLPMHRRMVLGTAAATTGLLLVCAPSALAAAKLPYTYSFTGLSGAHDGVRSPDFAATSRVCVDSTISLDRNDSGQATDFRVLFSLVVPVPGLGADRTVATIMTDDTSMHYKCFPSQPPGTYYVRIEKVPFQKDVTLSGQGTLQKY